MCIATITHLTCHHKSKILLNFTPCANPLGSKDCGLHTKEFLEEYRTLPLPIPCPICSVKGNKGASKAKVRNSGGVDKGVESYMVQFENSEAQRSYEGYLKEGERRDPRLRWVDCLRGKWSG
jgi:hypothetical protein